MLKISIHESLWLTTTFKAVILPLLFPGYKGTTFKRIILNLFLKEYLQESAWYDRFDDKA